MLFPHKFQSPNHLDYYNEVLYFPGHLNHQSSLDGQSEVVYFLALQKSPNLQGDYYGAVLVLVLLVDYNYCCGWDGGGNHLHSNLI